MLARAVLTILYLWHKQQHQISKQNNDTNKVAMDENKLNQLNFEHQISKQNNDTNKVAMDENKLNQLNFEISSVASKVPVSVQTFLDIGFSIRRFSNGTLFRQQRHYENKFWEVVSKIRAEKNLRQPDDRIYTPVFISKIIDEDAAKELMSALPQRFQLETPKLLFRLSEHGTSFVQLWTRIEQADQSLLIIKSTTREVFGAYVSSSWAERNDVHERAKAKYFGTGESFVWRLDDELKLPIIYTCGGGDAIAIRDELVEGSSRASRTYQSPELVSGVVGKIRAEKNLRQPDDRIYTPVFISKIIDEDAAKELMSALPQRFQLETPKLLFRLSEHGTSFVQLWTRIEQADQSLLIIKSTTREVFGAYVSSSWAERNDVHERAKAKYFGTGESFVWRLDDELKLPIIYTWSDQLCDNYFMAAHDKFLIIGSGGGDAIAIRDELVEGSSRASRTYQSPELVSGGQFQIDELEVWSIPSSI
uniref:TLDc domain-containing protein n=2 Tax=Meloidogyne TaxID=189290 RepID=A0A914MSR5_MELIC